MISSRLSGVFQLPVFSVFLSKPRQGVVRGMLLADLFLKILEKEKKLK